MEMPGLADDSGKRHVSTRATGNMKGRLAFHGHFVDPLKTWMTSCLTQATVTPSESESKTVEFNPTPHKESKGLRHLVLVGTIPYSPSLTQVLAVALTRGRGGIRGVGIL